MRNRGFTLLEVVLAIGLTGAVLAILSTSIELFMLRVDTSRSRVESAQLARTLLNMIAEDLQATRYNPPPSESEEASSSGTAASSTTDSPSTAGLYGTETELRIHRGAPWRWSRLTRELDMDSTTQSDEMPQMVRYFLHDGSELLASQLAAVGVSDTPLPTDYAGLYREQSVSTTENLTADFANGFNQQQTPPELLAPEVVEIRFAYFDGEELLEQWDSVQNEGLPQAVEIRLKLLEEPFETVVARQRDSRRELRDDQENITEYRLLVQLPNVRPARVVTKPRSEAPETTF